MGLELIHLLFKAFHIAHVQLSAKFGILFF